MALPRCAGRRKSKELWDNIKNHVSSVEKESIKMDSNGASKINITKDKALKKRKCKEAASDGASKYCQKRRNAKQLARMGPQNIAEKERRVPKRRGR